MAASPTSGVLFDDGSGNQLNLHKSVFLVRVPLPPHFVFCSDNRLGGLYNITSRPCVPALSAGSRAPILSIVLTCSVLK